ncbi:MAG: hypothetical protein ACRC0W_02885 [Cetobacterium sp.]
MNKRFPYEFAMEEFHKLKKYMEMNNIDIYPSGSLRREKLDVGDIDFVAVGNKEKVLEIVKNYKEIKERINEYEFLLESGISIHAIPEFKKEYIYTLWHSTGPKSHIKNIKDLYIKNKIEINKEVENEEEIYTKIGMNYICPKDRYLY